METLTTLQEKIEALLVLVKELKSANAKLAKENERLLSKLDEVTHDNVHVRDNVNELNEEKNRTKIAVQELIKSIDSFIKAQP